MFKIFVTETEKNHNGNLFNGFVNIDGEDLVFSTVKSALEWMVHNADFIAEFNHSKIVQA